MYITDHVSHIELQRYVRKVCVSSLAYRALNKLGHSLLYFTGAQLEKSRLGRYLTCTWHAAEALGSEEGRMCSVITVHTGASCVGADCGQRSLLLCTVVDHFNGCAAWGMQ